VLLGEQLAHAPLVRGVHVGVQQADADRADALLAEPSRDLPRAVLVEPADHRARAVEPLVDLLHEVQRHDALGLDPEVRVAVAVGHALTADLEHGAKAGRGDEAEAGEVVFEQRVGRHGRSVRDVADRLRGSARQPERPLDRAQERHRRVARRGRHLAGEQAPAVLHRDDVGERPAGVDADADAHPCTSSKISDGEIGMRSIGMPIASEIALAIAAATGIVPASPTPLTPSALLGDGVSVWCSDGSGSSVA
jgi:hypothetical protein